MGIWIFLADRDLLELWLKWTGVGLALLGTIVTSPAGFKMLQRKILTKLAAVWRFVCKFWPFRSQRPTMKEIHLTANFTADANLSAVVSSYSPGGSVEERLRQLKDHLDDLEVRTRDSLNQTQRQISDHSREIQRIDQAIAALGIDVTGRFHDLERTASRIQAEGLPVIAIGIFLSGVPAELATVPALGWTVWALGLSITSGLIFGIFRRKIKDTIPKNS